jgi:hypothetical protein
MNNQIKNLFGRNDEIRPFSEKYLLPFKDSITQVV